MDDVRAALTPAHARSFQIIYAAIGGLTLFLMAVLFFLYGLGSETPRPVVGDDSIRLIGIVLAIWSPVSWVLGTWLYGAIVGGRIAVKNSISAGGPSTRVEDVLSLLRTGMIIRIALFEGPALLGAVMGILGITDGVIFAYPIYLLCIVPACVHLFLIGVTFPTHERILNEIRERIVEARR